MPKKYEKILFDKESDYKGDDGGDRYSVYIDNKKVAEHLRFDELKQVLVMIEGSTDGNE